MPFLAQVVCQLDLKQEILLGAVVDVHGYFLESTLRTTEVQHLISILVNSASSANASTHMVINLHGCRFVFLLNNPAAASWSYLMDEVPDVSRVGRGRSQWVLVIVVQGPLIQTSDAHLDAL